MHRGNCSVGCSNNVSRWVRNCLVPALQGVLIISFLGYFCVIFAASRANAQWTGNDSGLCPNGRWVPSGPYGGMMCVPNQAQPQQSQANRIPHSHTAHVGHFGAIAFSPSDKAVGWSTDSANQSSADSSALQGCSQHGFGCRVVVRFNAACGAVAVGGSDGWGTDSGSDANTAQHNAIVTCTNHGNPNCTVIRWACSRPWDGNEKVDCGSFTCTAGNKCSYKTCIPEDAVDCGTHSKIYCNAGSKCSRDGKRCMDVGAVDCGSFSCGSERKCGSGNQCLAKDAVDCGKGKSCPVGNVCVKGGVECLTPQEVASRSAAETKAKSDAIAARNRLIEAKKELDRINTALKAIARINADAIEKEKKEEASRRVIANEQADLLRKTFSPANSTFSRQGLQTSVSGSTVSVIAPPAESSLAKAARERREAAIQRVSNAVGVKDVRDPKELAKLGLDRFVNSTRPDLYKGVKDIEGVAKDAISLAKSRRDGTFDKESQRVLNNNGLKLVEIIVKENKLDGVINVGKLRDTADLAAASNTYLQEAIRKYDANNAKVVAYQDVATAADRVKVALQKKREATPLEWGAADATFEKAKLDLLMKKRTAELVDAQEKDIKPDIKPLVMLAGKLTDKTLEPMLDPLSKTALAISKEAARDLPAMWVKIQATEAVTKADTQLAQSIQAALDIKKIRDTAKTDSERSTAAEKYNVAIKDVGIKQQEAEARRATNYLIRILPEDSVMGTIADVIAPERMIQLERGYR